MSYTTRVRILLSDGDTWVVTVSSESLRAANGLPSGKLFTMQRNINDLQTEEVLIRPYYRRFIRGELHVFAVQVMPDKEMRHGK